MKPVVSVVVVSDYADGGALSWQQTAQTLGALSVQDFAEPVEYILVERARYREVMPSAVLEAIPNLRVVWSQGQTAYELKNEGAKEADAEIVALLDADSVPGPLWLNALVISLREHPEVAVVSGPTSYPGRNRLERLVGLIGRSYLFERRRCPTQFVSGNNAGYRREVLLNYPLATDTDTFFGSSKLQAERLRANGHQLLFEPGMGVVHDYEGWEMEKDIRRNSGFAIITTRRLEPRIRFSWLLKLGYLSIPLFFLARIAHCSGLCLRNRHHYKVSILELPLAFGLAVIIPAMEIPGMIAAFRGRPIRDTAYR